MELTILLSSFLFFLLIISKIVQKYSKPVKVLPPGPKPLPIIGNIHQLINGSILHRILADLAKKHGPLMHLQLGEISTIVVSSAEIAKEFMNDHDIIFANRPPLLSAIIVNYNCQDIGFSPYGDHWRQMRKICTTELLSSRRVQTFRSIREEEVLNMVKSISSGSVVNLTEKIYSLMYNIISLAAFGKRNKHHEEFKSLIDDMTKLMGGFSLVDLYPSVKILEKITGMRNKLERRHNQIDAILESILNDHKDQRADSSSKAANEEVKEDLVDVLLKIQKSGELGVPLTNDHIKGVIDDIFTAGGETTSTTVVWAMSEMIKNPAILERAQTEVREVFSGQPNVNESQLHELKFLQAVIKETLRLHPAVPLLLPRESSQQCQIRGYVIPAKTRVLVNAWAIGTHPMNWADPEKFDPDRFLDSGIDFKGKTLSYIPFGAGRRICPGITFALPDMELALAQLLYHFDWKLPGEVKHEDLDMSENFGLTVGRKHDLELIPTAYN